MNTLTPQGKPFAISKWEVWEAYRQVKANKGAPGVDGCSLEDFEKDLKGNLYKIWNRMASGSYLPPVGFRNLDVMPHPGGTREQDRRDGPGVGPPWRWRQGAGQIRRWSPLAAEDPGLDAVAHRCSAAHTRRELPQGGAGPR